VSVGFEVDASAAFVKLAAIGPNVHRLLLEELKPLAAEILDDARSRAIAHFHSVGADPGLYLQGFAGGVSDKGTRVTGYVRNPSPLAHLLEDGFTIKDMMIEVKSGAVMAFEGDVATVFAREVHRHETRVQPYPALQPAFDARRGDIAAALQRVAERAGG